MSGTLGDLGELGDGTRIAGFGGGASDPYMMELMRRRAMADALAKQGMAEAQRPMTHWLQPLGSIVQQGVGAWRQSKADDQLMAYAKSQAEGDAETRRAMMAMALRMTGQGATPAPQPQPVAPSQGNSAAPRAALPTPTDPNDLAIRTMLAEDGRSPEGMAGVASVIRNRVASGKWGDNPGAVVLAPQQFSPWNQGSTNDPRRFDPNSPEYKAAQQIWARVNSGAAVDPTGGALHFANPAAATAGWVGKAMAGDPTNRTQIGGHYFFRGLDVGAPGPRQQYANAGNVATDAGVAPPPGPMPSTPPVAPPMAAGGPPMLDKNPMLVAALMGQASRFPGSQRLGASLATIARAIPDTNLQTVNVGGNVGVFNPRTGLIERTLGPNVQAGHALDAPDVEGQQLRYRQAGATNVALNNDKSYGGHLAEGLAKQDLAAIDTARGAADQIATARRIRTVLEENPIVGAGQPLWMAMAKGLNIAGLTDDQRISSTQALVSELARVTQEHIKSSGLGGGSGFSNADRDFLEKARAGTIEYTPPALRYLADLNEKAARLGLARGNAALARIRKNPNTASLVEGLSDFTDQLPDTSGQGASAPAAASSAPVKVATPEEAAKLPPGTRIELPDGSLGVVPGR